MADIYSESNLVRIAKRENNNKRKYLVLNRLQGKHVPVSGKDAFAMFDALAEIVGAAYTEEKLLLCGFAETATAIGARLAIDLKSDYIQTTREQIEGVEYLYFTESHSHATEQKLVKDDIDAKIGQAERIIFVEDEVTTGNTILKIVEIIKKLYPGQVQFSVASLLNGMDEASLAAYREHGIRVHYLVKTEHSAYTKKAEAYRGDGTYIKPEWNCEDGISAKPEVYQKDEGDVKSEADTAIGYGEKLLTGSLNARRCVAGTAYEAACEKLWEQIRQDREMIPGQSYLVIGTEEFMYPALLVALRIEECGCSVKCHSTTRSPIAVSTEEEYPVHKRYELVSFYEEERVTYIYDLDKYDHVLVITDAKPDSGKGMQSLVYGLSSVGNQNITLYRWGE